MPVVRTAKLSALLAVMLASTAIFSTAQADIAGTSTTSGLDTLTSGTSSYERLQQQITSLEADAVIMKVKLDSGQTSDTVSTAKYNALQQQIADLKAAADALNTQNTTANNGSSGINTGGTSGSGSSGSTGNSIGDAIKQGAITGALQGLLGGTTGTQNPLNGGLTGLLGGGLPSAPATLGQAQQQAATKPVTTKPATKKPTTPAKPADCTDPSANKPTTTPVQDAVDSASAKGSTPPAAGQPAAANATATGQSPGQQIAQNGQPADATAKKKTSNCETVDYDAENPIDTGGPIKTGTDGSALHGSKLTSRAAMDAQIAASNGQCVFDSKSTLANSCQCATLTKADTDLGATSTWSRGDPVQGNTDLAIGTPVSTFCGGTSYTNGESAYGCSHTGLYAGQTSQCLILYNQFNNSGGPKYSCIPWSSWNGNTKEGGSKFYTIATNTSFYGIPSYLRFLDVAFYLIPSGEGLAKTGYVTYNG